jgi:RecA/RadA recombinase
MTTSFARSSALDLLKNSEFLSIGSDAIDLMLGGGLLVRAGIHEFFGEASCGKTQICMQCAAMGLMPKRVKGLQKKVLIIYTQGSQLSCGFSSPFPMKTFFFLFFFTFGRRIPFASI